MIPTEYVLNPVVFKYSTYVVDDAVCHNLIPRLRFSSTLRVLRLQPRIMNRYAGGSTGWPLAIYTHEWLCVLLLLEIKDRRPCRPNGTVLPLPPTMVVSISWNTQGSCVHDSPTPLMRLSTLSG